MRVEAIKSASTANAPVIRGFGPGAGRGMPGGPVLEKSKGAKDTRATLLRLWSYGRRQGTQLGLVGVLVVFTSLLTLLGPYLLSRAIDTGITPHNLPQLVKIALIMLGVYGFSALLTWFQGYIMAGVAGRTVQHIRDDAFAALERLPLRYFDSRSHGDVMSRLTNDVENVSQVLTDSMTALISGLLGLVGSALFMLWLNPLLGVLTISIVSGLSLGLNRWLGGRTREAFRAQQAMLGALNGYIEETIGGQRVVKAYGREEAANREFKKTSDELRTAATRAQTFAGFIGPLMNGVNNLSLALVAGVGGILAVQGHASVGTIAAFINYARQFGRPLNDIANLYNTIQSAIAGAERVFEVMDEQPETDVRGAQTLGDIRGEVVFQNVDFAYNPETPVLRDVSLRATPGEMIALIGPTGAGKTTIINLLTRFYDIQNGTISVDGQDISQVTKESLRRQLGIVLQDTFLFTGTIRDNIRYGRPEASEEEIIAAAKSANAHAFIHRLPHGYDTELTQRGSNLSQGQRQLLAIARAILADPGILILDEATSSVDTRTERHIQEAMRRLMDGRTSFVIAHRLSTIREADQILVINAGQIIERGTHEELLAQNGFYARLSSGHFGGDADMMSTLSKGEEN